ncbi:unnamed protein product [Amoebophrya sp. A25]|nr:unnamed protein product [Amoebophrya sp. A25]|eukprot:GSA25T00025637001.1
MQNYQNHKKKQGKMSSFLQLVSLLLLVESCVVLGLSATPSTPDTSGSTSTTTSNARSSTPSLGSSALPDEMFQSAIDYNATAVVRKRLGRLKITTEEDHDDHDDTSGGQEENFTGQDEACGCEIKLTTTKGDKYEDIIGPSCKRRTSVDHSTTSGLKSSSTSTSTSKEQGAILASSAEHVTMEVPTEVAGGPIPTSAIATTKLPHGRGSAGALLEASPTSSTNIQVDVRGQVQSTPFFDHLPFQQGSMDASWLLKNASSLLEDAHAAALYLARSTAREQSGAISRKKSKTPKNKDKAAPAGKGCGPEPSNSSVGASSCPSSTSARFFSGLRFAPPDMTSIRSPTSSFTMPFPSVPCPSVKTMKKSVSSVMPDSLSLVVPGLRGQKQKGARDREYRKAKSTSGSSTSGSSRTTGADEQHFCRTTSADEQQRSGNAEKKSQPKHCSQEADLFEIEEESKATTSTSSSAFSSAVNYARAGIECAAKDAAAGIESAAKDAAAGFECAAKGAAVGIEHAAKDAADMLRTYTPDDFLFAPWGTSSMKFLDNEKPSSSGASGVGPGTSSSAKQEIERPQVCPDSQTAGDDATSSGKSRQGSKPSPSTSRATSKKSCCSSAPSTPVGESEGFAGILKGRARTVSTSLPETDSLSVHASSPTASSPCSSPVNRSSPSSPLRILGRSLSKNGVDHFGQSSNEVDEENMDMQVDEQELQEEEGDRAAQSGKSVNNMEVDDDQEVGKAEVEYEHEDDAPQEDEEEYFDSIEEPTSESELMNEWFWVGGEPPATRRSLKGAKTDHKQRNNGVFDDKNRSTRPATSPISSEDGAGHLNKHLVVVSDPTTTFTTRPPSSTPSIERGINATSAPVLSEMARTTGTNVTSIPLQATSTASSTTSTSKEALLDMVQTALSASEWEKDGEVLTDPAGVTSLKFKRIVQLSIPKKYNLDGKRWPPLEGGFDLEGLSGAIGKIRPSPASEDDAVKIWRERMEAEQKEAAMRSKAGSGGGGFFSSPTHKAGGAPGGPTTSTTSLMQEEQTTNIAKNFFLSNEEERSTTYYRFQMRTVALGRGNQIIDNLVLPAQLSSSSRRHYQQSHLTLNQAESAKEPTKTRVTYDVYPEEEGSSTSSTTSTTDEGHQENRWILQVRAEVRVDTSSRFGLLAKMKKMIAAAVSSFALPELNHEESVFGDIAERIATVFVTEYFSS